MTPCVETRTWLAEQEVTPCKYVSHTVFLPLSTQRVSGPSLLAGVYLLACSEAAARRQSMGVHCKDPSMARGNKECLTTSISGWSALKMP